MFSSPDAWSLTTRKSLAFKHADLKNMQKCRCCHFGEEICFCLSPKRPYTRKDYFFFFWEKPSSFSLRNKHISVYFMVWLEALPWKTSKSLSWKDRVKPFIFKSLLHVRIFSNRKLRWHGKRLCKSIWKTAFKKTFRFVTDNYESLELIAPVLGNWLQKQADRSCDIFPKRRREEKRARWLPPDTSQNPIRQETSWNLGDKKLIITRRDFLVWPRKRWASARTSL